MAIANVIQFPVNPNAVLPKAPTPLKGKANEQKVRVAIESLGRHLATLSPIEQSLRLKQIHCVADMVRVNRPFDWIYE